MLYAVLNRYNDGLVHLVGHYLTDNGLSHISITHCNVLLSLSVKAELTLTKNGGNSRDVLLDGADS